MNIHHQTHEWFGDLDLLFPHIPILAYHHVVPDDSRITDPGYTIHASQFEQQMRFLHSHGYRCLDLTNLFCHQAYGQIPKNAFVLTFDDGFEDFFTQAYPIFRHFGFTATLFLVAGKIGGESDWNSEQGASMLKWDQIKTLSANKISFGSHSYTHSYLPNLTHEQIQYETIASKNALEASLNQEILFFAYPYGESNSKIRGLVAEAGYAAAFGMRTGKPGLYNWWRCECNAMDNCQFFPFKLTWSYSFFQKLRGWAREETLLGRFLRSMKYRLLSSH